MVAWTNAPRLAAFAMVQPEFAADAPPRPVSWYGVARPFALSGWAGTMMSQSVLSDETACTAGAVEGGLAVAPRADWLIFVVLPPETARTIPRIRPNAIGMARGTAMRAARLCPRRRDADRCPLSINPPP